MWPPICAICENAANDPRRRWPSGWASPRQAVAKWETGNTLPDLIHCEMLADLYDVTLNDLVRYDPEEAGSPIPPKNKHLFGTVTVGERGQVVLPKKARDVLGIARGDTLVVLGDTDPQTAGLALIGSDMFLRMTGQAVEGFFGRKDEEHE